MTHKMTMALEGLRSQQDVFLMGPLRPAEQGALLAQLTRLGSGVVVSASRTRLGQVDEQLAGRKLKIARTLRGRSPARKADDPNADVELLALQQLDHWSGAKDWALLLDDVLTLAMDSEPTVVAVRQFIAQVDAACVLFDLSALCGRYARMLCLDAFVPAAPEDGEAQEGGVSEAIKAAATASSVESSADAVFDAMRAWRREHARERGVPAFRVMSDRVLREVINEAPQDLSGLRLIPGVGAKTIETLGKDLLGTLALVRSKV